MARPVVGMPLIVPVSVAQNLLDYSSHNAFPVYDPRHRDPQARVCCSVWASRMLTRLAPIRPCSANAPPTPINAPPSMQTATFRLEGLIMRSQLELLLR